MTTYYLAYGSNLNLLQMKYRCPNAKKVGTCMLKNYRLEFRTYLTVIPSEGYEVPLGIFEITKEDEKNLDYYEGYPTFYRKEYIDVELNGEVVKGLIYIMNDVRSICRPSERYLSTCLEGYRNFGFDPKYIKEAFDCI